MALNTCTTATLVDTLLPSPPESSHQPLHCHLLSESLLRYRARDSPKLYLLPSGKIVPAALAKWVVRVG